jgi:hypothetical protein
MTIKLSFRIPFAASTKGIELFQQSFDSRTARHRDGAAIQKIVIAPGLGDQ